MSESKVVNSKDDAEFLNVTQAAGRYCLGQVKDRLWWAWWCLECRPYAETERN